MSHQALGETHRVIFALIAASTVTAQGYSNARNHWVADDEPFCWPALGFAAAMGVLGFIKLYAFPGRDVAACYKARSEALAAADLKEGLLEPDVEQGDTAKPEHQAASVSHSWRYYVAQYGYLLITTAMNINNLYFLAGESAAAIRTFCADAAVQEKTDFGTMGLLVCVLGYLLIDAPFVTPIEASTSHQEVFRHIDPPQSGVEYEDRLLSGICSRRVRQGVLQSSATYRFVGSSSHTVQEMLGLLLSLHTFVNLCQMHKQQPLLAVLVDVVSVAAFFTVWAQTYYYEGAEQQEACGDLAGQQAREKHPPRCVLHGLNTLLPLSLLVHGGAESLGWLGCSDVGSGWRLAMAALAGVNELLANAMSEYREARQRINQALRPSLAHAVSTLSVDSQAITTAAEPVQPAR